MIKTYFKFHLHYFPVLTGIWLTITYLLVYTIAVLEDHVSPLFPYISLAGSSPPESCIFGFMLNIGAIFLFVVIYVKYQYLKFSNEVHVPDCLNNGSYILGMLACLGVMLVANFQETNVLMVHMLGALFAFGFSTIYCCIQTWITWRGGASQFVKSFRLVLCMLLLPTLLNNFLFGGLALKQFVGTDTTKWKWEDGGYNYHLAATFSEWIMAISLNAYIFSFVSEFRSIRFEGVVFTKQVDIKC